MGKLRSALAWSDAASLRTSDSPCQYKRAKIDTIFAFAKGACAWSGIRVSG